MAINLELPRKLEAVIEMGHKGAAEVFRPISRKYDLNEHAYPVELDTISSLFEGISEANTVSFAGTDAFRDAEDGRRKHQRRQHVRDAERPRSLLGRCRSAAVDTTAGARQCRHLRGGHRRTTQAPRQRHLGRDGDHRAVLRLRFRGGVDDGGARRRLLRHQRREDLRHRRCAGQPHRGLGHPGQVKGRAAIKSFVVPREHPGVTVERLEHKLGIKASDTAAIRFDNARIPKENLLGSPDIQVEKGFAGVMETFDNTRPIVAAMALGVARAALEELRKILTEAGVEVSYDKPTHAQSAPAAEFLRMEADWEAAYLLTVRSAWQADNGIPNSKEASMGKAKAARVGSDITLKAVELAGTTGYSEQTLLEKWARTPRSSISSRAPSRFSCWWWRVGCWA